MTIQQIRENFPILKTIVNNHPLIYLDNAATGQLPQSVVDAMQEHIFSANGNVHRGIHTLSDKSSRLFEDARQAVADFLHAPAASNIVFTNSTTDSIHLVAASLEKRLAPGDEILVSQMEHHSNFIPWQQICLHTGARLRIIPLTEAGELDIQALEKLFSSHTRFLAVSHCSNVTGIVTDIKKVCSIAHNYHVPVLVDGAQGCVHLPVNVQTIDCDFYCFSGHKLMSPTGIGVLYGKAEALESLSPIRFGGGMVRSCTLEKSIWEDIPHCLEAGTPNYIAATGLKAALEFRGLYDTEALYTYEKELMHILEDRLKEISGIDILGKTSERTGCISFTAKGAHPFDIAAFLDQLGIAVRSGHHCAMPLLKHFQAEYAVRVSPCFFNTRDEISFFLASLEKILHLLRK